MIGTILRQVGVSTDFFQRESLRLGDSWEPVSVFRVVKGTRLRTEDQP